MKHFLLLTIIFTSLLNSFAVDHALKVGIPEIKHFNRREYNGATQNWAISQSKNGLIYFGNNFGLLEYDGEDWQRFNAHGNRIIRAVKAIDDKVYVGSTNEIGFFKTNSSMQFRYTSLTCDSIKNLGDFWEIHQWGEFLVFRSEQSLCFFKNHKLSFSIKAKSRFLKSFVVNGLLLVQDEQYGILEIRGQKAYPLPALNHLKHNTITTILPKSDAEILIGTQNNGLFLSDLQNSKPWSVPANSLLKSTSVFCGLVYNKNYYAFGTIQNGLIIISREGEILMVIDKNKGLKNNTVLSINKDHEGNIWTGLDNGIAMVTFNTNISFIGSYYNTGTGYIAEKLNSKYYLGTNQGLFSISDKEFLNPLKNEKSFVKVENSTGQVWSMYNDNEGNLLMGHNLGIYTIKKGKANSICPKNIRGAWVFKPFPSNPNKLIVGTYDKLVILERKNNTWNYLKSLDGFSNAARFIEWDNQNNLWISNSYLGLVFKLKIDQKLNKIAYIDTFTTADFPNNESPLNLCKIDGNCIFTGQNGMYYFDDNGRPLSYNMLNKYFTNNEAYPNLMLQDKFNDIWYFTAEKVGVLRRLEDGSYQNIQSPFVQLNNNLVNGFENVFVNNNGNALIGIEDGFAHYSKKVAGNYKLPLQVHIRAFKSTSDSIEYRKESAHKNITPTQNPSYPFHHNTFEIRFAAPFFEEKSTEYATYLKGYDKITSEWTSKNTIQYARLKEGKYTFIVRAKNQYGVISEPNSFSFIVKPPWYRTLLAKLFYIILFIIVIIVIVYFSNKRVERHRLKEKEKQQERFKKKEDALKRNTLIAEKEVIRLRNEKLKSEMMHKEKELANSTMGIIQKNEFLADIKKQLNEVKKLCTSSDLERKMTRIIKNIDKDLDSESYWQVFELHLEQVHEDFLARLTEKHQSLSSREQKLAAYIKMGMSSKEIASLMNISSRAVENNRYRLRQKLGLLQGDNLSNYIAQI